METVMTNEKFDAVITKMVLSMVVTQLQIEALVDILNPIQRVEWMKALKHKGDERKLNAFTGEMLPPDTTNEQIHKHFLSKFD